MCLKKLTKFMPEFLDKNVGIGLIDQNKIPSK